MGRKSGYYWIKLKDFSDFEIGYYSAGTGRWKICFTTDYYFDHELEKIREEQVRI